MSKLAHQIVPPPSGPLDASTRNYANAAGGGAWSYIRTEEVTGSAVQDLDILGLDGNRDERYLLIFDLRYDGASLSDYDLYPNGTAITDGMTERIYSANGVGGSAEYENRWLFAYAQNTRVMGHLEIAASAATATERLWHSFTALPSSQEPNPLDGVLNHYGGFWDDDSTNITSLRIHASIAGGLAVGTKVHVYKLHKGPIGVAAQGAYIQAKMSVAQTGIDNDPAPPITVLFDTAVESRGDLSVDANGRFKTLKAGRTYDMFADLQTTGTSATRLPFKWYNLTDSAELGSVGTSVAASISSSSGYPDAAVACITPTTDIEVEIRTAATPSSGTVTIDASNSWGDHLSTAIIMEIGAATNIVGETVLSAAADTISVPGLDGDAHGEYIIDFHIKVPGSSAFTATAHPNGETSNLLGALASNFDASPTAKTAWEIFAAGGQSAREAKGRLMLTAARTQGGETVLRSVRAEVILVYTASPYCSFYHFGGYYNDATANLTSFDLVTTLTDGFSAGSRVTIRKA